MYLTDGNGGLLPDVKDISFAFGKDNSKKWTYSHGYDNKGNLSEVNLAKTVGGRSSSIKYAYDDANRLKTEVVTVGGTKTIDRTYDYQSNGKGRIAKITDKLDGNKSKEFSYDGRGRISRYSQGTKEYTYSYDNFGNVEKKKENDTELYSCEWERGNLLKKVTKSGSEINYEYNHRCVRFRKTANGVTTNYYLDGSKILGESRSDGKELRYFYDRDGLLGLKYGDTYYGYIKDGQGNITAIVNAEGFLVAQYEYDVFGNTVVKNASGNVNTSKNFIGNVNPFRWKGFYYDVETGMYYANGRYYETERGGYIDAIEADVVEGNAYNAVGLDRNGITAFTILMLAPYSASISTMLELYTDPNYEPSDGVETEETPKSWWKKHWWEVLVAAVNIVVGVVKLATGNITGILNIVSGVSTLVGAIFSEQLAGAIGTATLGVQTIMIGLQSLACNPVYGLIAIAVGVSCVAFASAEAQEALGYGNWLKDVVGMSDEVYNGVMTAVNIAAIAINIVGVKQCFKEGTLVACLDENGEEVRKPIESIAVGTLVLAYDEPTGEKAYKKVLQLFRNETKEWYHITVNGEEIVCTGGHPFYSTKLGKFVPARNLEVGDNLLLSDGTCGTIESGKVEQLFTPETTYNFEVEDFHTYYVGDIAICVHNKCSVNQMNEQIKKGQAPKGVERVDNGLIKGEQIHVHLKGGTAVNIDGTFKHGNGKGLTVAIIDWLKGNGWKL